MRRLWQALVLGITALVPQVSQASAQDEEEYRDPHAARWSIAIHGGAGTMRRDTMTPAQQADYKAALQTALDAGSAVLKAGGSALDAVEVTIRLMEDDPRFNAGKGAVYTWEGTNELDASIMEGNGRNAGAATGITRTRHPISLARKVMEDSPHVFLAGEGAEQFAREQKLEEVDPGYFETDRRKAALERFKASKVSALDVDLKFGTVGAVALDLEGNLAAGTSTGGMTGKRWGRIGDSPVIGAGTYADNRSCAVSATGAGEYFIRVGVAKEICSRLFARFRREIDVAQASVPLDEDGFPTFIVHASEMILTRRQVQEEVDGVIAEVGDLGGDGGVIVATPIGYTIFSFNTEGMYRGRADSDGLNEVAIFGEKVPVDVADPPG